MSSRSVKKFHYNVAVVLHWIVAFMAGLLLMSGWRIDGVSPENKHWFVMVHASFGTTVMLLMLFRWWWRTTKNLYSPPKWYKRPSMLLQWLFYPLLVTQPILGFIQALFTKYDVVAYGFLNYSAIAAENEELFQLFHKLHGWMAWLLIMILLCHIIDKARQFFADDSASQNA